MDFEREIRYPEYWVDGEKKGNCGYLKYNKNNSAISFQLELKEEERWQLSGWEQLQILLPRGEILCRRKSVPESREQKETGPEEFVLPQDSKWRQLQALYPHITPFQDDREYLTLRPADFVLLSEQSYSKANNSFMLHGYAGYKHLVLARVEKKGETVYYLGTPGNLWEKEKQAAVLFGFESFECKTEPAKEGTFGYYMMRVEL